MALFAIRQDTSEGSKKLPLVKFLWRCCSIVDNISKYTGLVLRWIVFGMIGILCYEVILRGVFNNPTDWAHESSQYFFGLYFAVGGAFSLWHGGMVRVDILIKRFKPRTRAIIEAVTGIVALVFLVAMTGKGADLALYSIKINETSFTPWGPPIWPLKIIVVVGAFLLLIQVIANLTRDTILATTGKEQK